MNLSLFPPQSTWTPPAQYPDLRGVKVLGVDVETKDPLLRERGPGSFRKDGHLTGVSLATNDSRWYFPLRHLSGGNLPLDGALAFLADVFKEERTWIGANLQYEMEWLNTDGFSLKGKHVDVQVVQALIDEEQESNALDVLCKQYLNEGKDESLLRDAAIDHDIDPKSELWKMHSKYVGPYAEFDAYSVVQIFKKQWEEIKKQELEEIFTLESKVTPILWEMRKQGFRVDLEAAAKLSKQLLERENGIRLSILQAYNCHIDEWSGPMLARKCQELGITYPHTTKGNPSFEGDWLDAHDHPFLKSVAELREINRLRDTFVEQWIFKNEIDGVIHCEWKQLVSDDGGTRTGRMAAKNPNPQQVPARSDLAPLVRALFIPMHPGLRWLKRDYSQQEPRLAVHFAVKCGFSSADMVKMAYRDNPKMDIYQFMADSARITRRDSKDLTLGRFYGMGAYKLAHKLGVSVEDAKKKLEEFDQSMSWVRELANLCTNKAQERGWLRTLCGRKRHFNWWEPADAYDRKKVNPGADLRPRKLKEAQEKWPNLRLKRAHTQKALNSLIQGSAADMTKSAMVMQYEQLKQISYLQVHDELDDGVEDQAHADRLQEIAINCVKLEVPMRVDAKLGAHWS